MSQALPQAKISREASVIIKSRCLSAYLRVDTPQFEIKLNEPLKMKRFLGEASIASVVMRVDEPQAFKAQLVESIESHRAN